MGSLQGLMADIDDWCGTRVPGHHPPRPHGLKDLLISVAISELAAQVENQQIGDQIQRLSGELQRHAQAQVGKATGGG
jgi:hypothetical protein